MKKIHRKLMLFLLCALMFASAVVLPVSAVNDKDLSVPVTLDLSFVDEGTPVVGFKFSAYRVAGVYTDEHSDVAFTLEGDFADCSVSFKGLKEPDWPAVAETVAYYAKSVGLTPYDVAVTGEDGVANFPADLDKLEQGLYLIIGEDTETRDFIYTTKPFLISLPSIDINGEDWVFDVDANVKYSKSPNVQPTPTELNVIKIWAGDELYADFVRPESVTVHIFDGSTEKSVVELNEGNNWSYTWEVLDTGDWSVTEDPVDMYVTTIVRDGDTFVITNRLNEDEIPEDLIPREVLPQTGMIWWPVYVLVLGGILLFGIGYLLYRKHEN